MSLQSAEWVYFPRVAAASYPLEIGPEGLTHCCGEGQAGLSAKISVAMLVAVILSWVVVGRTGFTHFKPQLLFLPQQFLSNST